MPGYLGNEAEAASFLKTEEKEENVGRNVYGIKETFEKQMFSRLSCLRIIHAQSTLIITSEVIWC